MENNSEVYDLNSVDPELLTNTNDSKGFCMMDGLVNPEIVFTFGNSSYSYDFLAITMSGYMYGLGFRPSQELRIHC